MKLMNSSLFCFLVTVILLTTTGNVDARKRNKYKSQGGSSLKSKTKTNWSSSTFRDDDEPKAMISTEEHGYYVKRTYSPLDNKYTKATTLQSPPYLAIPIAWFSCGDQCPVGNSVVINDKTTALQEGFLCDDDCNGPYEPICGQTPREVAVFYNKCKLNVAKCRTHGLWMDLEFEECSRLYTKEVEYAERKFRTSPYFRSNAPATVDDDEGHEDNKDGLEDDKKGRIYDEEEREDGKEVRENDKEVRENDKEVRENDEEVRENDKEVRENDKEVQENDKAVRENDKEVGENDKEVRENEKEVRENDKEVRENDKEVQENDKEVRENDKEVGENDKEVRENEKEVRENDKEVRENDKEVRENDKEVREDDKDRREDDKDGSEDNKEERDDATLQLTVESLDDINYKIEDAVYQAETEGPKSYIDTSTIVNEIN